MRILLLLLITPIVELALLIRLGAAIGFWPTVAVIAATAVLGSYLLRREGLSVWRRFNDRLRSGQLPGTEVVDGMIILVAGSLLITPGVITDVLGLVGLIPVTRGMVRVIILRKVQRKVAQGTASFQGFGASAEAQTNDARWAGEPEASPRHRSESGAPPASPSATSSQRSTDPDTRDG